MCDNANKLGLEEPRKLEKLESSSCKRRRKRGKKVSMKPRKLFHDDEDAPPAQERTQPAESTAAEGQQTDAEVEENSSEKEGSDDFRHGEASDEDEDVFGGKFRFQTPPKSMKKLKNAEEETAPDTAPSVQSQNSATEVSPYTVQVMDEAHALMKKVDKRILDCLPAKMNQLPGFVQLYEVCYCNIDAKLRFDFVSILKILITEDMVAFDDCLQTLRDVAGQSLLMQICVLESGHMFAYARRFHPRAGARLQDELHEYDSKGQEAASIVAATAGGMSSVLQSVVILECQGCPHRIH